MILSFFTMNKVLITNLSLNINQSEFTEFYPIIFTLLALIASSGVLKIIQRKKTSK
ncbi:hypothetical protein LGK97_15435 [Clostridium sp. CS001]|uniref:hypothetical protein n=1 Tax=Clostridium sp. CS001 TaxID=2880648 RepID=UPI001CF2E23F|nr:hypothetical protein [Clostridium sp. CS001]MCB2291123.1 hypothetical protein [Clostridium sp. CS001]